MSANRFGEIFQVSSFGESHGPALGVLIEGCPAGISFQHQTLNRAIERRRPGRSAVTSARNEADTPEILSGVFEGKTLGTPIAVIVRNQDARPQDYAKIKTEPRRGHADDVWLAKFGHVDYRGGGRSSGRETLARVIGGAFAEMLVHELAPALTVKATATRIGDITMQNDGDWKTAEALLNQLRETGDSVGGVVELEISQPPQGLGQPVYHKLKADLTAAMMSIGAVTAVELGGGFEMTKRRGLDVHVVAAESIYGGIRGGISTGETIHLNVAFKPTSSILDVAKRGRHDPCIVLRALPVVEAMAYLVMADHLLWQRLDRI